MFPEIVDNQKNPATNSDAKTYNIEGSIGLPEISSCVVMTSRRRKKKKTKISTINKKPRKKSGRYFPEISTEDVLKRRNSLDVPRSMSSTEEYSPKIQRKKKTPGHTKQKKCDQIKLPNI